MHLPASDHVAAAAARYLDTPLPLADLPYASSIALAGMTPRIFFEQLIQEMSSAIVDLDARMAKEEDSADLEILERDRADISKFTHDVRELYDSLNQARLKDGEERRHATIVLLNKGSELFPFIRGVLNRKTRDIQESIANDPRSPNARLQREAEALEAEALFLRTTMTDEWRAVDSGMEDAMVALRVLASGPNAALPGFDAYAAAHACAAEKPLLHAPLSHEERARLVHNRLHARYANIEQTVEDIRHKRRKVAELYQGFVHRHAQQLLAHAPHHLGEKRMADIAPLLALDGHLCALCAGAHGNDAHAAQQILTVMEGKAHGALERFAHAIEEAAHAVEERRRHIGIAQHMAEIALEGHPVHMPSFEHVFSKEEAQHAVRYFEHAAPALAPCLVLTAAAEAAEAHYHGMVEELGAAQGHSLAARTGN